MTPLCRITVAPNDALWAKCDHLTAPLADRIRKMPTGATPAQTLSPADR